jgi:hypothetical protein
VENTLADVVHVTPPDWWQIVLVGMSLPADHPSIQVRAHKKDVPDNWRGQRTGKGKMKARDFDNAIRAGQREVTEARVKQTPGMTLRAWEFRCARAACAREEYLCLWLAGWDVVPFIVRPHLHNWASDGELLKDLRKLGVEPECWAWDDDSLDRVPVPGALKAAA